MEREFAVEAYGVDCGCSECDQGVMVRSKDAFSDQEGMRRGLFKHECSNCQSVQYYKTCYPEIRHRRVAVESHTQD